MIDTKALRSRILDLAIQGKLTEQLESDGTAEELYQQIQAEKDDIIKKRQGRKDNSIKPVEDDVPYEIPVNWKWIRFGETGFFRKGPFGSSLTKSMFVPKSDDSIKVYEQQHAIKKDHTLGTYYITKEYFDESMKGFEVLPDDIIISCAGTIGETFIMPNNIEKGIINQALMRVTVIPSIDKQFFLYYFNSQLKESAKEGNGSAITNIPPFDVLKNLYFPLPPLAEQKRIVERVEEIFRLLDTIDKAQEKYAADSQILKAKLITAGIQGKLTKQLESDGTAHELYQQIQEEKQKLIKEGKIKKEKPLPPISPDEIPFEIPQNWVWVRLSSLGTFSSGKTPSMAVPAFWDGDIPWVTSKDMKTRIIKDSEMHITELGAENMQIYPAGTLLLVVRSGILRRMLPLCVLGVDSTINQDLKAFSLYNLSISPWLYFAIKAFEPYILKNLVKAMTTVESLKFDEFSSMLLPLPPLAEQKRIADVLERVLGEIDKG